MDIIKVSGTSRTSAVAGAIAGVFRESKKVEIQAIGAGAVNQAVKAMILARGYLAEDGYEVVFTPEFVDIEIDDKVRTAVKFTVVLNGSPTASFAGSSEDSDSDDEDEDDDNDEDADEDEEVEF